MIREDRWKEPASPETEKISAIISTTGPQYFKKSRIIGSADEKLFVAAAQCISDMILTTLREELGKLGWTYCNWQSKALARRAGCALVAGFSRSFRILQDAARSYSMLAAIHIENPGCTARYIFDKFHKKAT